MGPIKKQRERLDERRYVAVRFNQFRGAIHVLKEDRATTVCGKEVPLSAHQKMGREEDFDARYRCNRCWTGKLSCPTARPPDKQLLLFGGRF